MTDVRAASAALGQPGLRRLGRRPDPGRARGLQRRRARRPADELAPNHDRRAWPTSRSPPPTLTERDVAYLANASALYALFERDGDLLRAGRLRRPGPLRRRPDHDPEVSGQDQRAVHQAAAQRHRAGLGLGRPDARPSAAGARPAVRPRHHPQPGADLRLRRGRDRPRRQGLRGVRRVPADLSASASGSSTEPRSARYGGRRSWSPAA